MNDKEKALEKFLEKNNDENSENTKKKVIDQREGLIERVDKTYITRDGRQLLREHY